MECPIIYDPFLPVGESSEELDWLMKNAPWVERTSARFEAFWSPKANPYTYGQGRGIRTYHPEKMPLYVEAMGVVVAARVADLLGWEIAPIFDLCFLNRYEDQSQHLGWHADDSPEQDDSMPIVVQSFGAKRDICYRENGTTGSESIHTQTLAPGSLFIMKPGMQQTHQHKIPKHSAPCGRRISLTWRVYK